MSTVSVDINFSNYAPKIIYHMLKAVKGQRFDDGQIDQVSTATATTNEADLNPKPIEAPKRGRDTINPRQAAKRPHGNFKSFGWSVECVLHIPLETPFKGETWRKYTTKVFSNKIQVPGCYTEDYSDVYRIARFLIRILKQGYAGVLRQPPGFDRFLDRLDSYGEQRLCYADSHDFEQVELGKRETYSRNYTVHGPLVHANSASIEEDKNNPQQAIHLRNMYDELSYNDQSLIAAWRQRAMLEQVQMEYVATSENTSRRLQFIFTTPQYAAANNRTVRHHITKAFFESSGKINIELTNNYVWPDVIWRIISFLSNLFNREFYRPRMLIANSGNIDRMKGFFAKTINDDELTRFVSSMCSSDSDTS